MTPFHPTFRRLLRQSMPQVHDEDLNRHDSLFALRHQLIIDKHIVAEKYVQIPPDQLKSKQAKPKQQESAQQESGKRESAQRRADQQKPDQQKSDQPKVDQHKADQQEEQQPESEIDKDIADATAQAQAIFAPYARVYNASLRQWVARRQLVLQQGNFFQIPLSLSRLGRLIKAILYYRWIQLLTLPLITVNRIKTVSVIRVISFIVFIALLLGGVYTLTLQKTQLDQTKQEQKP